MANPEHLARLAEGVETWNQWRWDQWRYNNRAFVIDLAEANLCRAELSGVDFSRSVLFGAHLIRANFSGANLRAADLHDADLREVDLRGADLSDVDLRGACLILADLRDTNLSAADLRGADLRWAHISGAKLGKTILANTNLIGTKGLESCNHSSPSSVGIDTVFTSGGAIPESFLRGCGVPEPFIVQMKSLIGAMEPIQFYSCFISYSSHDQAFAERLNADLRAKNLRCWFAPEDLKIGDRFQERIEASIQVFDKVMIVLSEASVKSRWVEREVNAAREREDRENRTVLFPIRIDDTVMNAPQPWAADIRRSRHIGDFREWEAHSSYVKAFERLLRDLKAENAGANSGA